MSTALGCARLGGLYRPITEEDAHAVLETAWQLGVRRFDTAPHYGVGQSEEFLGRFLAGKPRDSFVVSTKVGRLLVDDSAAVDGTDQFFGVPSRSRVRDYSADGVHRSLEESMARMGLDRVDVALIHDPEHHMDQAIGEAAPALAALREGGAISAYGVGTNYAEVAAEFVRHTDCDRIMIAGRYTLLDRRAEQSLLSLCRSRDVAVMVAGVLNSGLLADPRPGANFNYAPASDRLIDVSRRMQEACIARGVSLRAAALQFPQRHPAVTDVVIGPGSVTSVLDTFTQLAADIPEELWAELDALLPDQEELPT